MEKISKIQLDLMFHKEQKHKEKVSICRQFSGGNCVFGDKKFWFIHSRSTEISELSEFN